MSNLTRSLQEISSNKTKNIMESENNFLEKTKFWRERIKFNTPLFLIFFAFFFLNLFLSMFIVMGFDRYLSQSQYMVDLINIVVFLFALYMSKHIPQKFQEMLDQIKKRELLKTESSDTYELYEQFAINSFNSKFQYYIPMLFGIIFLLSPIYYILSGSYTSAIYSGETVYFEGIYRIYNIISNISYNISYAITGIIAASGIAIILSTFKCINKLGNKSGKNIFPLGIDYKDLKTGALDAIGRFILSTTLPVIVLSTFVSIIGLYNIVIFGLINTLGRGFLYVLFGLLISLLVTFLLYRDTTNIHDAIAEKKEEIKEKLMEEIQAITPDNPSGLEAYKEYKMISNIHEYSDRVESVSDWPFNPTSIKKLLIILGSSIVPFILSFIGLG